jgi:tetratricopeptide (TPR) repeat protein
MARSVIRAGVVLLAACLSAAPAGAASDPRTEKAREHYLQGDAFYKLDRYANALQEYEQAYLAKPDPSFLYNIAQCHRLMGDKAEAIKFYRRYLKDAPTASNREVAEKHIKDLAAARAAPATPPAAAPAGAPIPPPASAAPMPAPVVAAAMPAPRPAAPPATNLALAAPPPAPSDAPSGGTLAAAPQGSRQDENQPIYTKWWFWTGVGVVVVGGLLLALSANKSDPSCPAGRMCQ